MRRNAMIQFVVVGVLAAVCAPVSAAATDETEMALLDAGMYDVLEARLLQRLDLASSESERSETIARLAEVYARLLREFAPGSPERADVADRAWALVNRSSEHQAGELRLVLLIDGYVEIERSVALLEIGLLTDEQRGRDALRLSQINARFSAIAVTSQPAKGAVNSENPEIARRAEEAIRVRSLSNYYAGWSGLMLSILEDREPGGDVQKQFGWLLGAEGGLPMLDSVRDGALSLDHVARSAIGVARTKHRLGDAVLAGMWLDKVLRSSAASDEVRAQAATQRLRFLAENREWHDLLRALYETHGTGDSREPMTTQDARFFAIRALGEIRDGLAGPVVKVAELALRDLVERGEIGHVLDLRDRFGALPTLEDGFIARYADGLERLTAATKAESPVRYLDAAGAFQRASEATDAARFEAQRDDALLKRVFCLVRGGRPAQAAEAAEAFLAESPGGTGAEEARWLRIVALEVAGDDRRADDLRAAVIAYLADYPGTERSRALLVRYAASGILDEDETIKQLRGIPAGDRIVGDAKAVLIRLMYRDWVAGGRIDPAQRAEIVGEIRWLWDNAGGDDNARAKLDVARIAIDVALSREPKDTRLAERALALAGDAMAADASLAVFRDELTLRRVEWLVAIDRLAEADEFAGELRRAANTLAEDADRMILAGAFDRLRSKPGDKEGEAIVLGVGVRVVDRMIPPAPDPLGVQASGVVSRVIEVAIGRAGSSEAERSLALRLGRVLLERGTPTGQIVRDLAGASRDAGDADLELLAWSVLLAASSDTEASWWESRYQTLRLLRASDPDRAEEIYEQHRVLYPLPGLLPWTRMIDELFGAEATNESPGADAG